MADKKSKGVATGASVPVPGAFVPGFNLTSQSTVTQVSAKDPAMLPSKIPAKLPAKLPSKAPAKLPAKLPSKLPAENHSKHSAKPASFHPANYSPYNQSKTDADLPAKLPAKQPSKLPSNSVKNNGMWATTLSFYFFYHELTLISFQIINKWLLSTCHIM